MGIIELGALASATIAVVTLLGKLVRLITSISQLIGQIETLVARQATHDDILQHHHDRLHSLECTLNPNHYLKEVVQ